MYHFAKNLQRHFICCYSAGYDIVGACPIQCVKKFPLTGKYTALALLKRYIGIGNFLIQGICFFFRKHKKNIAE